MTKEQAKAFVREVADVCKKYNVRTEGILAEIERGYATAAFDIVLDDGVHCLVAATPEPDDWNTRQVPFTVDKDAS